MVLFRVVAVVGPHKHNYFESIAYPAFNTATLTNKAQVDHLHVYMCNTQNYCRAYVLVERHINFELKIFSRLYNIIISQPFISNN